MRDCVSWSNQLVASSRAEKKQIRRWPVRSGSLHDPLNRSPNEMSGASRRIVSPFEVQKKMIYADAAHHVLRWAASRGPQANNGRSI
jgi:hypothetical protein